MEYHFPEVTLRDPKIAWFEAATGLDQVGRTTAISFNVKGLSPEEIDEFGRASALKTPVVITINSVQTKMAMEPPQE